MQELFGLTGKTAIVLGGGQGMGADSALLLAQAGCDVAVVDQVAERAKAVAEQVRAAGRRGIGIACDVLDDAQLEAAMQRCDDELGGPDVLVSVIGMSGWGPVVETTDAMWDLDHRRNLRFFFVAARSFGRRLIAAGRPGSACCIASVSGLAGAPNHAAYGAAKAGLMSLVRSLAVEWAPHRIRVNAVVPGAIYTPRIPRTPAREAEMQSGPIPMKRRGTTNEIGRAVLFLVSDMASYTTGHALPVDGGWTSVFLLDRSNAAMRPVEPA